MNETMHAIREPVEAWFRRIEEQRSSSAGEPRPVAEDVTVVIKTLGREILRQALRSIAVGEVLPARVVVVHQGDDERVCKWAEELSGALTVEYVADERRRAAAGINRGLERVRTRFVALTDDDCVDAVDWIARLAERLRAEPDRLVTGRVEPVGDQKITVTSRALDVQHRPRLRTDRVIGANLAGAIDVFRHIGPFDEDACLASAEDLEYAYRALRAGVSITYDPDVVVGHVAWRDGSNRDDQYAGYGRSLAGFYGKYLRRGDLFMVPRIVVHLLKCSMRWLTGVLRRDPDRAANGRAYVRWFVPGFLEGWRSAG